MAAYVDYTYYSTTYGGAAISSASFTALANQASAFIDLITMGRAAPYMVLATPTADELVIIDKIKMATCAVVDEQYSVAQTGGVIASESVGSHSISYAAGTKQTVSGKLSSAAYPYLALTGLMFRGFYADEYGTDTLYSVDN